MSSFILFSSSGKQNSLLTTVNSTVDIDTHAPDFNLSQGHRNRSENLGHDDTAQKCSSARAVGLQLGAQSVNAYSNGSNRRKNTSICRAH